MLSFILYIIFTISYFLHLPARFPWLGEVRFDFIMMGVTLLAVVFEGRGLLMVRERTMKLFLLLIAYVIVTMPLVEWPGSVMRHGLEEYSKTALFFLFTVSIIDSERKLKVFMLIFIACQLIRVAEPAYLHVTTGYWGDVAYSHKDEDLKSLLRLSGAPNDVVNPNQLAWVIVGTIPFLYYLLWRMGGAVNRLLFLAPLPLLIYALVLTGSRSGMVSLAVVILSIIFMGRNRFKRAALLAVVLLPLTIFVTGQVSPELVERYSSLISSEATGRDTVIGRVESVQKTFSTVLNKPIVGHGLGTSKEVSANFMSGRAQRAHNLYVEILQEIGLMGLVIFGLFVAAALKCLSEAKRAVAGVEGASFLPMLATAIQVWMIMDLFYSLSCFGLSSWEWYLFGGLSTVCLTLAREHANEARSAQAAQGARAVLSVHGGKAV